MNKILNLLIFNLLVSFGTSGQTSLEWFQYKKVSLYSYGAFLSLSGNDVVVSGAAESSRRDPDTLNWGGFVSKYSEVGHVIWEKRFYSGPQAFAPLSTVDKYQNIYLIVGSALYKYSSSGELIYCKPVGPYANIEALSIDSKNNIVIKGNLNTDLYTSYEGVKLNSSGFIAKYLEDGSFVWVKDFFYYPTLENAFYMCLDEQDNIYTVGAFLGTVQFAPFVQLSATGSSDGYIAKYDSEANLQWVKTIKGDAPEAIHAICVNKEAEIFVAGYYGHYDNPTVSYLGNLSITVPANSKTDVFVAKYSATGNCEWVRTAGGDGIDCIKTIACDNSGNVFVAGHFKSSVLNFGNLSIPSGEISNSTMFLAQYNDSGDLISVNGNKGGGGLSCDLVCNDQGDLYYTGAFGGNFTFGSASASSEGEMFLMKLKYDPGNLMGIIDERPDNQSAFSIRPNPSGESFTLTANVKNNESLNYRIMDAQGKVIMSQSLENLQGDVISEIDLSNRCKGIYYLEVVAGEKRYAKKLIRN